MFASVSHNFPSGAIIPHTRMGAGMAGPGVQDRQTPRGANLAAEVRSVRRQGLGAPCLCSGLTGTPETLRVVVWLGPFPGFSGPSSQIRSFFDALCWKNFPFAKCHGGGRGSLLWAGGGRPPPLTRPSRTAPPLLRPHVPPGPTGVQHGQRGTPRPLRPAAQPPAAVYWSDAAGPHICHLDEGDAGEPGGPPVGRCARTALRLSRPTPSISKTQILNLCLIASIIFPSYLLPFSFFLLFMPACISLSGIQGYMGAIIGWGDFIIVVFATEFEHGQES